MENDQTSENNPPTEVPIPNTLTNVANPNPPEKLQSGSQMQFGKQPFDYKKYIKYGLIGALLLIAIVILSYFITREGIEHQYDLAKERCGHEPISIYKDLYGIKTIELGRVAPMQGDKYYCTLTDASNDGQSRGLLDSASEDIKRLYP